MALAPLLLWRARAFGDTFDSEGRRNPRPILYNFGGPLLIFGWFLFWIGMNCCYYYPGTWDAYIYIASGFRMLMSCVAGVTIILAGWTIGYGLDELENETGLVETAEGLLNASAFGLNGWFCGFAYEIKVVSIIAWAPLGLASFYPHVWGDYTDWILLLTTGAMGYSMAMIQEQGLRMVDGDKVELWSTRSDIVLAVIALLIPLQRGSHYFAYVLSIGGALAFALGRRYLLRDQKRGIHWILSHEIQVPNVFSYGVLLSPLGALLLSWAVTMHPN